jgi:hypothetical protein
VDAAGLLLESIHGQYSGQINAPSFDQSSLSLVAARTVPGLLQMDAAVGYTRRREGSGTGQSQAALTGNLGYQRELSGKTSLKLNAFRRLRSNTAGAGSVHESGLDADLRWQVTPKTGIDASYQWTTSDYGRIGQSQTDAVRRDRFQQFRLMATWHARPWLALRPYFGYQRRTANQASFRFNGYTVGFDFTLRFEL